LSESIKSLFGSESGSLVIVIALEHAIMWSNIGIRSSGGSRLSVAWDIDSDVLFEGKWTK